MRSVRALLEGSIDYAGLFPPASLALGPVRNNFASYLRSADAWLLGRLVLPVAAVLELADHGVLAQGPRLSLSVLLGDEPLREWEQLAARLQAPDASSAQLCSLELKVPNVERLRLLGQLPRELEVFCEVEVDAALRGKLETVAASGRLAKLRTGSLAADGIPPLAAVAEFVQRCHDLQLAYKATAGLHHALRGKRALSYADDAAHGVQHGFVNLCLGAALLHAGEADAEEFVRVLDERSAANFHPSEHSISWRTHRLDLSQIEHGRRFLRSFGSCSFEEPCADLREMGWLT